MTQPFVRGEIYFGFKEHFIGLSKYSKKKNRVFWCGQNGGDDATAVLADA
jgi:hypothetical protein